MGVRWWVWEAPCCQPGVPKRKEEGLLLHTNTGFLGRKEPSLCYRWRKLVTEVFILMPHAAVFSFAIFKAHDNLCKYKAKVK